MKLRQQLHPDEWDFRGLVPAQSDIALHYEMMRERTEINELTKVLTPEIRREIRSLHSEEELDRWLAEKSDESTFRRLSGIFWICWCCQGFPKPWMALPAPMRRRALKRYGPPSRPYRILTWEQALEEARITIPPKIAGDPPRILATEYPTRRYVVIQIDWSAADDTLLKPVLGELLRMRPERIHPHKRHTGKGAASHMHKFKKLAAWRLATRLGLNYKGAQELIDQRRKEERRNDTEDLLPYYKSAGAWKKAVDAGKRIIKRGR